MPRKGALPLDVENGVSLVDSRNWPGRLDGGRVKSLMLALGLGLGILVEDCHHLGVMLAKGVVLAMRVAPGIDARSRLVVGLPFGRSSCEPEPGHLAREPFAEVAGGRMERVHVLQRGLA